MDTIERHELQELLDGDADVRVLMTLGPGRFAAAHIPGTETFAAVDAAFAELRPEENIVVYCTGGHASVHAYRWLESRGYRRVRWYAGGLVDWHAAGLPVAGNGVLAGCSV
jgi:rhodanese-related sulfurtransferase